MSTDYRCKKKKEGVRRRASVEDSVDASIQRLEDFRKKRGGILITATTHSSVNTGINRIEITRQQKWKENRLHGRFKRLTSVSSHNKT